MVTQTQYKQFYEAYKDEIVRRFADTERADYEAEVWYSYDRNWIHLDMIGNRWKGKDVIALGSAFWPDAHLLENIPCKSTLRTDLIWSEGIELLADVCNLPFADKSVDAIVCREVIEHLVDQGSFLWEVKRVLRDGGGFLITTPNGFNVRPDGTMHRMAYTPSSFLRELRKYGFGIIDKRGDCPNVWHSLMPLCQMKQGYVLEEFKEIAQMVRESDISYYIGTDLFVLAQKI